jgi:hypothetical protein
VADKEGGGNGAAVGVPPLTGEQVLVQPTGQKQRTDKKENQIFLIYKEIQSGAVAKSYMTNGLLIWGNICAFPHILGSPSSSMTLQLLHSEFPYI